MMRDKRTPKDVWGEAMTQEKEQFLIRESSVGDEEIAQQKSNWIWLRPKSDMNGCVTVIYERSNINTSHWMNKLDNMKDDVIVRLITSK